MNRGAVTGWRKPSADLRILRAVFDGGGSVLATGAKKAYLNVPFDCELVRWRLLVDPSGSIAVDVWRATYDTHPPVVAGTIVGGETPSVTTATKNESTALTGWTKNLAFGDILEFNINSVATVTKAYLDLFVRLR